MKTLIALLVFAVTLTAQVQFQLNGVASEASSTVNGAVVTPAVGPPGVLVVNGTGSVLYGAGGVSFSACCANTNNAFYKFTGAQLGSIFGGSSGEIDFTLTSAYSFTQRQALTNGFRYVFDVQDVIGAPGTNQYGLTVQASATGLTFSYSTGNKASSYYIVPAANADAMFGFGKSVTIRLSWSGATFLFSLNGSVVKTSSYTPPVFNWSDTSTFLIGAQPYNSNGYNANDDSISGFTVIGAGGVVTPPPPPPPPPGGIAPQFTSATQISFTTGAQSSFTIIASGTPAPIITLSGTLPAGLMFDANTGILSGICGATSVGTYNVTFSATNSAGGAIQTLTIMVAAPVTIPFPCTGLYDATAGTVAITCQSSASIPATAFTNLSALIQIASQGAQWQIDAKKFLAAFGNTQ